MQTKILPRKLYDIFHCHDNHEEHEEYEAGGIGHRWRLSGNLAPRGGFMATKSSLPPSSARERE